MQACMTLHAGHTVAIADDVEVRLDEGTDTVTFLRDGWRGSVTGPWGIGGSERRMCDVVREALGRQSRVKNTSP